MRTRTLTLTRPTGKAMVAPMIIGVAGLNGAGKGEVVRFLEDQPFGFSVRLAAVVGSVAAGDTQTDQQPHGGKRGDTRRSGERETRPRFRMIFAGCVHCRSISSYRKALVPGRPGVQMYRSRTSILPRSTVYEGALPRLSLPFSSSALK